MLYPLSYEGRDLSENVSEIRAQVDGPGQMGSQQCCGGLADVRLCHRRQCSAWQFVGWSVSHVDRWVAGLCGRPASVGPLGRA